MVWKIHAAADGNHKQMRIELLIVLHQAIMPERLRCRRLGTIRR